MLIVLVPTFVIGIGLIGLGLYLIENAIVDVILHTAVETQEHRLTEKEAAVAAVLKSDKELSAWGRDFADFKDGVFRTNVELLLKTIDRHTEAIRTKLDDIEKFCDPTRNDPERLQIEREIEKRVKGEGNESI